MKNPDWKVFITEAYLSLGKYLPEKNKLSSKYLSALSGGTRILRLYFQMLTIILRIYFISCRMKTYISVIPGQPGNRSTPMPVLSKRVGSQQPHSCATGGARALIRDRAKPSKVPQPWWRLEAAVGSLPLMDHASRVVSPGGWVLSQRDVVPSRHSMPSQHEDIKSSWCGAMPVQHLRRVSSDFHEHDDFLLPHLPVTWKWMLGCIFPVRYIKEA